MEIKKEEKQHKCRTCGKVFGCRQDLYRHKLSCQKPKSYKYDGCNVTLQPLKLLLYKNGRVKEMVQAFKYDCFNVTLKITPLLASKTALFYDTSLLIRRMLILSVLLLDLFMW